MRGLTVHLLAAAVAGGAVLAGAGAAAGDAFTSPSGNIRCVVDDVSARCVTLEPRQAVLVGRTGPAKRVSFARLRPPADAEVLAYGDWIAAGGYYCRSRRVGVSCVNQDTRKGYRIAREGVTFFPPRPSDVPPAPERRPAPEQPTTEPDRSGCDPNYQGACVPIVPYDLDCADIDGTVYVRGDDPHRFDGDGDGVGCEA